MLSLLLLLVAVVPFVRAQGRGVDEWRKQSIYQIITDRFAVTNGSTDIPCDPDDQVYCGGTFAGITNKLDYIQGMGFTAVSLSWPQSAVRQADH